MRVAVLGSASSWYMQDLQRAAAERGDLLQPMGFTTVGARMGGSGDGALQAFTESQDWDAFDALLVRTMPPGSLEQVIFRMDVLGQWQRQGRAVLNPPRAIEIAVDKFLATSRLQEAGLRIPRTIVCQSVDEAMTAFATLGEDVVVKPLFGSEGRGMTRVTDVNVALRVFKTLELLNAVIYLQQFIPHLGCDLRLLVIGPTILGMRRCHPTDWRTNLSRGAIAEPFAPDDQMRALARSAAEAVGAPLAGVDILPGRDGHLYLLEVNAVPGWKGLAQTCDRDIAKLVLDFLESWSQPDSGQAGLRPVPAG